MAISDRLTPLDASFLHLEDRGERRDSNPRPPGPQLAQRKRVRGASASWRDLRCSRVPEIRSVRDHT
jgi:hypothetical protein